MIYGIQNIAQLQKKIFHQHGVIALEQVKKSQSSILQ